MPPENVFWDPVWLMNIVTVIIASEGLAIFFLQSKTFEVEEGMCDLVKRTQLLSTFHIPALTRSRALKSPVQARAALCHCHVKRSCTPAFVRVRVLLCNPVPGSGCRNNVTFASRRTGLHKLQCNTHSVLYDDKWFAVTFYPNNSLATLLNSAVNFVHVLETHRLSSSSLTFLWLLFTSEETMAVEWNEAMSLYTPNVPVWSHGRFSVLHWTICGLHTIKFPGSIIKVYSQQKLRLDNIKKFHR